MLITFTGLSSRDNDFFSLGFSDDSGDFNVDLITKTAPRVVTRNPVTDWEVTALGSNFAFDSDDFPTSGTITFLSFADPDGNTIATIQNISWGLVDFVVALDALYNSDDESGLVALLNSQGAITIDASDSQVELDLAENPDDSFFTQPVTIFGTEFSDTLLGGSGDDLIFPGTNPNGIDVIFATEGDDTIRFSNGGPQSFYGVEYELFSGINVNVNGVTGTGSVATSSFTDTFEDTDLGLNWGIGVWATSAADTYTLTVSANDDFWQYFEAAAGAGNDNFNLTFDGGGTVRINFRFGGGESAFQGVTADLASGTISNDGYGNTDSISVSGDGRVELRLTDFGDDVTGDAMDNSFITEQGNDSVDGGDGFDRVRYDRFGVDAMTIDLEAGTASGNWDNLPFTDLLSNVEWIRGSRFGDDEITGSASAERFEGEGGNDTLIGAGGNDTLEGEDGNDSLNGGFGFDTVEGGDGDDSIAGGAGADEIHGDEGNDEIFGNSGIDTIMAGGGDDFVSGGFSTDEIHGDDGNDELQGRTGADTLFGGAGNDTLRGSEGIDFLFGGSNSDELYGATAADVLYGEAGRDTLFGSQGRDFLSGGDGNDELSGGSGADTLNGDDGDDELRGNTSSDTLDGGEGNDSLFGGTASDLLLGANGDDLLAGQKGADTLTGGAGNDTLRGGEGPDVFDFGEGFQADIIEDFDILEDRLQLSSSLTGGLTDGSAIVSAFADDSGANVVFDFGGSDQFTMEGITTTDGLASLIDVLGG